MRRAPYAAHGRTGATGLQEKSPSKIIHDFRFIGGLSDTGIMGREKSQTR
jgi:hypothetical protein